MSITAGAGDCTVVVGLATAAPATVVGLALNRANLQNQVTNERTVEFMVHVPLQVDDMLQASVNGRVVATTVVDDSGGGAERTTDCGTDTGAREENFFASLYLGSAVDTFAPDEVGGYQNLEEASSQKLRFIGGVKFDGRVWGTSDGERELWLHGETLHGVRTADVDCRPEENRPPVCDTPTAGQFRYIVENASSLEAHISPTLYLMSLQEESRSPISLYVTGRFGFIALEDTLNVHKNMHVGTGVLIYDGPFADSYFEVGWGTNELIDDGGWNRFKVDAVLSAPFDVWNALDWFFKAPDSTRVFIRMWLDNDLAGGSPDSVQTLFGFDFDLGKIAGW